MMIGMVAVPVTMQFLQIKIIALYWLFAIQDYLHRSLVECNRGKPGQRSQALLAACIASVDLHFVGIHMTAPKAAYRIYTKERAMSMCDALQLFYWLPQTSGGFRDSCCKY